MAVELFHYRGAAKDVGTLEYVFEAGQQKLFRTPVTKEQAAEDRSEFHDDLLSCTDRRVGNAGVPDNNWSRLLFGHGQNGQCDKCFSCRSAAGWDGRCAERGEAAVRGVHRLTKGFCFFLLEQSGEIQNRCTSDPSKLQKYHILC